MTNLISPAIQPMPPSALEALLAGESARRLAPQIAHTDSTMELRVVQPDGQSEPVAIPTSALRLLVAILAEMAAGNAVRVVPHQTELTTQEAADLLNTSRPYLVRLLDDGRIPSHKVGTHRRVLFNDVMNYKSANARARRGALERLSALDQDLGLT